MIHLDTSFLVDLLAESAAGRPGPALALLDELADEELGASVLVLSDLFAAAEEARLPAAERRKLETLAGELEVAYPDERFPLAHARLQALMRRLGVEISATDLVIAAAALVEEVPLVTRDQETFGQVPGLEVITYSTRGGSG